MNETYRHFVRSGQVGFAVLDNGLTFRSDADATAMVGAATAVDSTGLKGDTIKFRLLIPTRITAALSLQVSCKVSINDGTVASGAYALQLRVKKNQGSALATVDSLPKNMANPGTETHNFHVDLASATYEPGDYLDFEFQFKVTTSATGGQTAGFELLHDSSVAGDQLLLGVQI